LKFLFQLLFIFIFPILLVVSSCKSSKQPTVKQKPDWVQNRPVNRDYYVGIGTALKTTNNISYQQIAKKNAFDDMISEIQVNVSSSSVLKSVQNNLEFKQQFNATTKVTASNTIEKYDVIDSWENGNEFWIYFRLSKAEFEAAKRRKIQVQISRAEDFMERADLLDLRKNFVDIIHLKIQALTSLQNYLNEDVVGNIKGKEVKLVDEIFNSIQDQLFIVQFKTSIPSLKGIVGKSLPKFDATALINDGSTISNLPLKAGSDNQSINSYDRIETDNNGVATFTKAHVQGAGSTLFLRIAIDIQKLITSDSLNTILKTVLMSMQPPPASIKVSVEPLKIYIQDEEFNLSKPLSQTFFEPLVKKEISQNGCVLVGNKNESDYIIHIYSNTQSQGVMWGNMLGASITVTFSITDSRTNIEIYKDGIQNIKGFQTTADNAGLDAYKKSLSDLNRKLIPSLIDGLFNGDN